MHVAGHAFYQAANGVWPTDHVPPGDLSAWPG
jgi:RNA:NAD 2'-phosphotransferase (TPT1/KptA family)